MSSSTKVGGITIEIGGDATRLTNALKAINELLGKTGAQLKSMNELLKLNPTAVVQTADKMTLLKNSLDQQHQKLKDLNAAYEQMKDQPFFDNQSQDAIALRTEIEKTVNEIQSTRSQMEQLDKQESTFRKLADTSHELGNMSRYAGEKIKEVGSALENVGGKLSIVSTAAAGVGTFAAKEFISFEATISKVAAAMGTTTDQIGDIEKEARRLGATTVFTAEESAEAFHLLATAGYDANKQIEIAPNVLNLAAAGGLSMADAAKYLTGTLNGFSKVVKVTVDETGELTTEFGEAKDVIKSGNKVFTDSAQATEYFADLMAKGATLAKTNVAELGEAMSVTASVANGAYGQSAESVTVALLRLADQNVTAAQAGTALNQVMARLYTPTKEAAGALEELGVSAYDSAGNARDVNEVVDELNGKLQKMTAEERAAAEKAIFAQRGLKSFSQMAATSADKTQQFYDALTDINGSAGQQAETMLDNVQGKITLLKSAMSESAITIGEKLKPTIETVTEKIRSAANWFNQLDESTVNNIVQIGLLVAAAGPLVTIVGKLTSGVGVLLSHPVLGTITLLTTAIAGLNVYVSAVTEAENAHFYAMKAELEGMKNLNAEVKNTSDSFKNKLASSLDNANSAIGRINLDQDTLLAQLNNCVTATGEVKAGEEEHANYILNELSNAYGIQAELVDGQIKDYGSLVQSIKDVITQKKAEAVLNSYQDAYTDALKVQITAYNGLKEAETEEIRAKVRLSEAEYKYTRQKEESTKLIELYRTNALAALAQGDQASHDSWQAMIAAEQGKLNDLATDVRIYRQELEVCKDTTVEYKNQYEMTTKTVQDYERVVEAMATGTAQDLTNAMTILTQNMKTAETASNQALAAQYQDMLKHYKDIEAAAKSGAIKISAEELKILRDMVEAAKSEMLKASSAAYGVGENLSKGLAKGIKDFGYVASDAATTVANNTLRQMKNVAVIKSPSHVTQYFGEMIDKGLEKGLLDYSHLPENAADEVMGSTLGSFNGGGILTAQRSGFGSSASTTNNTNVGGMTFIINSQPGQNVQELARQVSIEVQRQINSQKAVFA